MLSESLQPEGLIARARAGDGKALGRLLGLYRNYLKLLARTLIDAQLKVRLDSSDLAQETMMAAFEKFGQFQGSHEKQLIGWLRRILVHNLADQLKRHYAQRRDVRQQVSLEAALDQSSLHAEHALASPVSSPSGNAMKREQAVLFADGLAQLPPQYREVIILRHLERRDFDEIAQRMGRSKAAVRRLWARAIERFRHDMRKHDDA